MNHADDPHFAMHHPVEIASILDRLRRERILMTVECGDGHAIVSTVIELRRDDDALVFDVARDPAVNGLLFAAPSLAFVSELDGIPILFETGSPSPVAFVDGPAAAVGLPRSVTRLQRREWFRAALPLRPPVRGTVLDRDGNASPAQAIDLSCGGASVVVDDPAMRQPEPGSDHELILSIPEVGRLELEATLRTVRSAAGLPDALASGLRLGFRFDHVAPRTSNRIQRYVQRLEVNQLRMLKRHG